ncbi:Peroxisomal membrane protein 11-3 [Zea mays]|uniref:Peroxisomal membrane protein 11-3 n=1 Tax=Zea mays TaxID=4577 RepID=A0A3L6DDA2_MAIZE|nr:Peroxisomal membrane protein 11-3 [Zea mays]
MRPRQRFDRRIKHAIAASSVCGPAPVFYRLDAKVNAGRHGLHRAPQSYAGRTPVRGRGRRSPTGPRLPRPPRRRRQAPQDLPLRHAPRTRRWGPGASARLKSFESSVVLSRKGFRLGKFVQSLRAHPHLPPALALLAYGSEGVYYFVEQFVWLAKAGILPAHLLAKLLLKPEGTQVVDNTSYDEVKL